MYRMQSKLQLKQQQGMVSTRVFPWQLQCSLIHALFQSVWRRWWRYRWHWCILIQLNPQCPLTCTNKLYRTARFPNLWIEPLKSNIMTKVKVMTKMSHQEATNSSLTLAYSVNERPSLFCTQLTLAHRKLLLERHCRRHNSRDQVRHTGWALCSMPTLMQRFRRAYQKTRLRLEGGCRPRPILCAKDQSQAENHLSITA